MSGGGFERRFDFLAGHQHGRRAHRRRCGRRVCFRIV
jgi:hypothetical protein